MKKYRAFIALLLASILVTPSIAYCVPETVKPADNKVDDDYYWAKLSDYTPSNSSFKINKYPTGLLKPENSKNNWFTPPTDSADSSYTTTGNVSGLPVTNNISSTDYWKTNDVCSPKNAGSSLNTLEEYKSKNIDLVCAADSPNPNIYGDLSIGNDTGNKSIPEFKDGSKVNLNFSLNMRTFRESYNSSLLLEKQPIWVDSNTKISGTNHSDTGEEALVNWYFANDAELMFVLNLPKEAKVDNSTKYSITGLGEKKFNNPVATSTSNNDGTTTLTIKVRKKDATPITYKDLTIAINSIENVSLKIENVTLSRKDSNDKPARITGYAYGMLDMLASPNKDSVVKPSANQNTTGNNNNQVFIARTNYLFAAKQSDEGRDANAEKGKDSKPTKPNLITFSFKVKKPETYSVTYSFKSGTSEKSLPAEVTALLPASTSGHNNGVNITPAKPSKTSVDIKDKDGKKLGTWNFAGWSPTSAIINNADVSFVGTWNFTPVEEPNPGSNTPPIPDHPHDPETPDKPDTPVTPKNPNKPQEELQTKQVSPEPNTGAAQTEKSEDQQILAKTGVNTVFIAIFAIFMLLLAASLRKILPRQQIKHLR
ncbi:SHIRT domain-containing protein [Gardnerella vaginalis]|nr:SHIRT domain-containing protein [Gardnerella vaginalis]